MTATAGVGTLTDVHRRSVRVLVASQVLGGVGVASGIAVGGLLAEQVSGSTALSGLAQTATVLGAALLAVPMARAAEAAGRRTALAVGYGLGLVGAGLAVVAAVIGSFPLLLVATLLFGGGTASNLQARYAATDAAAPEVRARSLSVVVWATTVGAVAGPNLSGVGGRLGAALGIPPLSGPYLFSVVSFATAALAVQLLLRPDPLVAARAVRAAERPVRDTGTAPGPTGRPSMATTLHAVAARPAARLGLGAVAAAHAVMVGVMAMTPVHLGHEGASLRVVGIVISVHIAGMYAVSPLFGWLSDRVGRVAVIVLGLGTFAVSLTLGAVADVGQHELVGVSLALLGLGWSACLVAGSTLLTESVPTAVRTSVQGVSDLTMGLSAALAGGLSGPLLAAGGYRTLTLTAAVLLVPVVVLAVGERLARESRSRPVGGAV